MRLARKLAIPVVVLVLLVVGAVVYLKLTAVPYLDAKASVATRVDDLLDRMTLDDKVGQMTQASPTSATAEDVKTYRLGSILSGGGWAPPSNSPAGWADLYDSYQRQALATELKIPMIYGIDAVHGHNNVVGATIYPHNIGLGATRDAGLVRLIGKAVAQEVQGTGLDWSFSPCVCVARDPRWGRTYESYSDTPDLPSELGSAFIYGLQSGGIMATAKHFVGDGGTTGGVDQGNTTLAEDDLRAIHLPPFQAAVQQNVASVMVSYNSWNGVKLHAQQHLITEVLKGELGFKGFVVSDWNAVDQIDGADGLSPSDVSAAINAGIDMVMVPDAFTTFIDLLKGEIAAGNIPMSRIDDANRRILTRKFEYGLFEHPMADRSLASTVGNAEHRALARKAVAESQVLLRNSNGILPLKKDAKIFVAGSNANDIGNQSGGWTISWQGKSGDITKGTTILQGIQALDSQVTFNAEGKGIDPSYSVALAVLGEKPYAEMKGDRPDGLPLSQADLDVLGRLRASGVPTVVVLVSGRPLEIEPYLKDWAGLVAAWLPGTEGQGVADVLFGDAKPTGKLPRPWLTTFPSGFGLTY